MVNIESIFVVKGEYNNSQTFQVSQSQKKEMSIDITTRITKNTTQSQFRSNAQLLSSKLKTKKNMPTYTCKLSFSFGKF